MITFAVWQRSLALVESTSVQFRSLRLSTVTYKTSVARPKFFFGGTIVNVPPVPECRDMVAAARAFVDGDIHFSAMVEPIRSCQIWACVHNADATILRLANDWSTLVDRAWNEFGLRSDPLTVEELRARISADFGDS